MLLNTYEPWKFAFSSENDEICENSFGIIGVPFDSTTSYHAGARLGPIVVREASFGFEKYNTNFNKDLNATFYDFGDVNVVPGNCEKTCQIIEDTVNELIDLNLKPLIIGGEHSASIGAINALSKKYENLTVVHFDAHRDLAFEFIGEKYSHAAVMRRAHEAGVDLVQIGIRSSSYEEEEAVRLIGVSVSDFASEEFLTKQVSLFDAPEEESTSEILHDLNHQLGTQAFVRASSLLENDK